MMTERTRNHTALLCLTVGLFCFSPIIDANAAGTGGISARDSLANEQARTTSILDDSLDAWFNPIDTENYAQFKERVSDETGFEYSTYYALMNHYGTQGGPDSQNLNGQLHSINAWTPYHGCENAGTAIFYFMHLAQYTQTTAAQLSTNVGLTSGINDSAGEIDMFRFAAWYQPLADGDIELYAGQFLLRDLYDIGTYGSDDTRNFVSQIMSSSPAETLPAPGLGFAATCRLTGDWYIGGGFTDANAQAGDLWNFDTFSQGDYASIGYLAYRGCVCGVGQANYQFNLYSVDATQQAAYSRGLSLILEQDIGESYAVFFKYNRADKRQGDIQQSAAVALMIKGLCNWEDDLLGIGAGWGDPTAPTRRDEYVLEAFWRQQLTSSIQLTPNVQLWLDPSQTPGSDVQAVFSLRALMDF
jgi:hypothetical protein